MPRVLVVDDSRFARKVSRKFLEAGGYVVEERESVDAAWQYLQDSDNSVDLVLLDWNMPGSNGLELLNLIRGSHADPLLPVVFATSEVDVDHLEYAQGAGANGYVVKPFTSPQLLSAVLAALDHS